MLLGDQTRAYPSSEMLVKKARHVSRIDVLSALEETPGQYRYCIRVCLNKVCHDLGELDLILKVAYASFLVRKECGKRVDVVVVDLSNVRVRHDDERKVAERLDAVREADWEQ